MPYVIAELWVVEGQVHETDEGNGPRASDLGRNSGNECRVSYGHKESPYRSGTWKKVTPIAEGHISPISATSRKRRRVALAERLSQGEDEGKAAQLGGLLGGACYAARAGEGSAVLRSSLIAESSFEGGNGLEMKAAWCLEKPLMASAALA